MRLGNIYSEGLDVTQDYVEAFIWFGAAAAQGDKVADAFRNVAGRKLSPGRLAEAEGRLAGVLARQTGTHEPLSKPAKD